MYRQFIFVLSVIILIISFGSPMILAQSKDDGMKLFREARALQDKARSNEDLKNAVEKYEQALKIFEKVKFDQGISAAANNMGMLYNDWGQYQKALDYWEKALEFRRKLADVKGQVDTLNHIGHAYIKLSQYPKAVEYFEKSLNLSQKARDSRLERWTLKGLGDVCLLRGQYPGALEYYEKALELMRKAGDAEGEARLWLVMGWVYSDWGQNQKALELFDKSLDTAKKIKNIPVEADALNNMGEIHRIWGEYSKAMEYYERSLELVRQLNRIPSQGIRLNNLGILYHAWGQHAHAVEYYEKSLELKRKTGDLEGQARSFYYLGQVYQTWGQFGKALEKFQEGLELYIKIGAPLQWPKGMIGDAYLDVGDFAKAETLAKESNNKGLWGRLYYLKSDHAKAKDHYNQLLQDAEKSRKVDDLSTAYTGLGLACEGLRENEAAADWFRKAISCTERLREGLSPAEKAEFYNVRVGGFYRTTPYEGLARVLAEMNQPVEALKTSEYTKARIFVEGLSRRSEGSILDVPKKVIDKDSELNEELAALTKSLQKGYEKENKDIIAALEPQVKDARQKLAAHVDMLRKQYPFFAATKYPQPMGLGQTALKPNEWTLAYDVTDTGVLIYLTKGKELVKAWFKTIPRKELDELVRNFRQPLEIGSGEKILDKAKLFDFAAGKKLADILLADALSHLPKDVPLIIIPDDCLGVVPFEMLVLNDGGKVATDKQIPYVTGAEFFGDRNPISYYQSVTALTLARTFGKQKSAGEKSLVMDDPIFDPDDARFKQLAREKRQADLAAAPDKLLAAIKQEWKTDLVFPRLDRTHELGEALKKMEPTRTEEYTGMEASKKVLFEKPLDRYKSMVFATHGYFGKDLPGIMEPVLVLTLVNQPPGKDGYLRLSEVMGLKLNADIVALTACQTGLGRHISGEGTMGMGRAFQYAGARSVLMSLWNVSETASVKLVEGFFRNLKAGKNKLEALKLAREEIRKNGYNHPFYWAPFIMVGEVN